MMAMSSEAQKQQQTFNLISQANEEFNSKQYDKCLETLQELEDSGGGNTKLIHNRAVVEFYKSDGRDHATLMKTLNTLASSEVELLRANSLIACPYPIATYNKALIFFHRRMHLTAIEALLPLVEKLDSLDLRTAALVGVLMLRLLLTTNQFNKAHAFRELLQHQLGIGSEVPTSEDSALPEKLAKIEEFGPTYNLLSALTNVLNRKVVVISEDSSPEFAALKAHQYYMMKDFQMAAKQLQKINAAGNAGSALSDEINTCIANNMGVIHLRVRHYAIAAKFFQNAITFDKHITANLRTSPLHQLSSARSYEILYNLGISMLHLRRPKEAFQCFLVPLKSYHNNPRLWVRIAEACIMNNEIASLEAQKKPPMMMPDGRPHSRSVPKTLYSNQSAGVPEPNFEFASLSLRNALTLTKFYRKHFCMPKEDVGAESDILEWHIAKDNIFCNPSKPISKESLDKMLSVIYAAYSYVSLRLGDYVQALEMAQQLLNVDKLSDAHRLLAHMYAGEALLKMEKLAEARSHLEPTFVSSLNEFDFETKDWQVKSLDAAQNVVRYNLSVALVLQGDFEAARSLLKTCTHPIVAVKRKALKLHIDITTAKIT